MTPFKETLQERLGEAIKSMNSITGGDINDVYKIITNQNSYVLKVNRKDLFSEMFVKEKLGLEILAGAGVNSPNVIFTFSDAEYQYLLLEFIEEESINSVF